MTRTCLCCNKPLIPRTYETPTNFIRRSHCDTRCGKIHADRVDALQRRLDAAFQCDFVEMQHREFRLRDALEAVP